jgi:hypothetical protein
VVHGGALALSLLWLAKRNNNWALRLGNAAARRERCKTKATS